MFMVIMVAIGPMPAGPAGGAIADAMPIVFMGIPGAPITTPSIASIKEAVNAFVILFGWT